MSPRSATDCFYYEFPVGINPNIGISWQVGLKVNLSLPVSPGLTCGELQLWKYLRNPIEIATAWFISIKPVSSSYNQHFKTCFPSMGQQIGCRDPCWETETWLLSKDRHTHSLTHTYRLIKRFSLSRSLSIPLSHTHPHTRSHRFGCDGRSINRGRSSLKMKSMKGFLSPGSGWKRVGRGGGGVLGVSEPRNL